MDLVIPENEVYCVVLRCPFNNNDNLTCTQKPDRISPNSDECQKFNEYRRLTNGKS